MNACVQEAAPVSSRAQIRAALREVRAVSEKAWKDSGWYRLDRHSVGEYFKTLAWKKRVWGFVDGLKKAGEPVLYVDICGRADGAAWGADKTYTFSLQPLECLLRSELKSATHVRGDLFSTRDFRAFVNRVKEKGSPALVTFHPVVGLQSYTPNPPHEPVVYGLLESRLREIVQIVRPGGFIHLGKPFSMMGMDLRDFFGRVPHEQWESHLRIKEVCRDMGCSVQQGFEGDLHCHLIEKWRAP